MVNVGKNTSPMDAMGMMKLVLFLTHVLSQVRTRCKRWVVWLGNAERMPLRSPVNGSPKFQ